MKQGQAIPVAPGPPRGAPVGNGKGDKPPVEEDQSASRMPAAWEANHLATQMGVLIVSGVAALFLTIGSPILEAILGVIPDIDAPWGPALPTRYLVPLLLPVLAGMLLALTRHRAPLLLWIALAAALAVTGVLEVARLNWIAFAGGVAFRVESGPVPLVRTIAGLALILSGLLLLAQQSVHHHVALLVERGVPRGELASVRHQLLQWERLTILAALGAGTGLVFIAALSMQLTERAPEETAFTVPTLIWSGVLLAVIAGTLGYLARRRTRSA